MTQKIKCYTSSSIGPCPTLNDNFDQHEESVSVYWDDAPIDFNDGAFLRVIHHCEPAAVFPDIADKIVANHKYYDLIMTYDPKVLKACPNAVFLTEHACSWLPRKADRPSDPFGQMNYGSGLIHKNPQVASYVGCDVSKKEFAVSFLTSSKRMFPGHQLRQEIFDRLPDYVGDLRVFKHRSPPVIADKRTILEPYMFHICPENSQQDGYYTEKIVDCFVAKTIPIYWGCPDIGKYFNIGGILTFESYDSLIKLLGQLSCVYEAAAGAIEQNFQRALARVHQWDLMEEYICEAIARKRTFGNQRLEPETLKSVQQETLTPAQQEAVAPNRPYRPLRRQK